MKSVTNLLDEYNHSLFQSKDEPGEEGWTVVEEAPFRFRF